MIYSDLHKHLDHSQSKIFCTTQPIHPTWLITALILCKVCINLVNIHMLIIRVVL